MIGDVVKKAGEGFANATAGPTEGLIEHAFAYIFSPWGLLALGALLMMFWVVR
jgi:hypothetical protein